MENKARQFYSTKDKIILYAGFAVLGVFCLAVSIPLIYVVLASFIDPVVLTNQGISFNPNDWTLEGYRRVFEEVRTEGISLSFVMNSCATEEWDSYIKQLENKNLQELLDLKQAGLDSYFENMN